ncbi:MAG TPA: hypothetical protein VIJ47_12205 [Acidimicrobiales bacterium]
MSDRADDIDPEDDRPPGPRAAYAVNWYVVLAVDAAMGLAVVAAGVVAMVVWTFWLGAVLALLGCLYVAMVVRRADHWRRLRSDAGL